ncbi:hypothetical protein GWK47_041850 [Chionoecetes opilio]|uniref:Uncharacterized protein n=1 Tax=Chionoecetes opilio TaxID=41210 RepID=A0A8J4YNL6_CHIOP|nr:hypothetical protein GWK47_041850 [Chionoecetes opilio]
MDPPGNCRTTYDAALFYNTSTTGEPALEVTVPRVTFSPTYTPSTKEVMRNNNTWTPAGVNLTLEQRFRHQQQRLSTVPRCRPMLLAVKLEDELDRWDRLLDKELLPPEVPVSRCPYSCGLCLGGERCLPTTTANATVVVRYKGDETDDGGIRHEKREIKEHLKSLVSNERQPVDLNAMKRNMTIAKGFLDISESVAVTDLEYDAQSDTERNDAGRVYYEENEPQIVMGSYMFEPEYEVDEQVLAEPEVAAGVVLILSERFDINKEEEQERGDLYNTVVICLIFIVLILNVLVASLGVDVIDSYQPANLHHHHTLYESTIATTPSDVLKHN